MRVFLVGCGDRKQTDKAAAKDLYTSPAFANRRRIAEREGNRWFILSGLYGLLEPAKVMEPYNVNLSDVRPDERRAWSRKVIAQLKFKLGSDMAGMTFELLAPTDYCAYGLKEELERLGASVEWPVEGMRQFEQQAYYARRAGGPNDESASAAPKVSPTYRPLYDYLTSLKDLEVTLSFSEIEHLLGRPLPPSARKYPAWWSGSVVRSAIRGAGRSVMRLDLVNESVMLGGQKPHQAGPRTDAPGPFSTTGINGELVRAAVETLTDKSQAESAATFPSRGQNVRAPGLYSWWADEGAREVIGEELQTEIPPLIYSGQAGAGTEADLRQRICSTHIGGRIVRSTFRFTLASLLRRRLALELIGPERMTDASEDRLTDWIKQHLSVAVFPCEDRSTLRLFEEVVIREIDAPLNLSKMGRGDVRTRLTELRRAIRTGR